MKLRRVQNSHRTFNYIRLIFQYNQKPPIILLDCSKLQLGRGRLDDSVSSFRRRLELFRELTLPMLKTMDSDGRLTIVSLIFDDFEPTWLFQRTSWSGTCGKIFMKICSRLMATLTVDRFKRSLSESCGKTLII